MTSIELTKEQIEELKIYYNIELEKSLKRTNELKAILDKLDFKLEPIIKPVVPKQKTEKQIVVAIPKETNKHSKWSGAILELLQEKQTPLTVSEIVEAIVKQNNVPKADLKKVIYNINQSLYRLRNVTKKVKFIKVQGKTGRFIVITDWTDINDNPEIPAEISKIIPIKRTTSQQNITKPVLEQETISRTKEKHDWKGFVIKTLESKKRILNLSELVNVALKQFELKVGEKSRTKGNLSPALSILVKKDKTLKTTAKKGVNGRSYGLKEWFDESGNLIAIYK